MENNFVAIMILKIGRDLSPRFSKKDNADNIEKHYILLKLPLPLNSTGNCGSDFFIGTHLSDLL